MPVRIALDSCHASRLISMTLSVCSPLARRSFIGTAETRALLARYAGGKDSKDRAQLSPAEAARLRELLPRDSIGLASLVAFWDGPEEHHPSLLECPSSARAVLLSLARPTPVSGFVNCPGESARILRLMFTGPRLWNIRAQPDEAATLTNCCPDFAAWVMRASERLLCHIRPLCKELATKLDAVSGRGVGADAFAHPVVPASVSVSAELGA